MALKVGLVGVGGLGGALARGLGWRPDIDLVLSDLDVAKAEACIDAASRAQLAPSAEEAARDAEVVVLAVKPPHMAPLITSLSKVVKPTTLLVSCAAGVSLASLEKARGKAPLARVMPNVGASVGACTTAVVLGPGCEEARDYERLEQIFAVVGEVRRVKDEDHLHAITALSGSGPAFVLLALEAMEDAGVAAGLSRDDAAFFARGAFTAAAALAAKEEATPSALKSRVTSPGGTTIAGLGALERRAVRAAFWEAVEAATRRSRELSE